MPSVEPRVIPDIYCCSQFGLMPLLSRFWNYTETEVNSESQQTTTNAFSSSPLALSPVTFITFIIPSSIFFSTYLPLDWFISILPAPLLSVLCLTTLLTHRWNSFLSAACIMATMVFVTEVPILDPMMTGTADFTSSTRRRRNRRFRFT